MKGEDNEVANALFKNGTEGWRNLQKNSIYQLIFPFGRSNDGADGEEERKESKQNSQDEEEKKVEIMNKEQTSSYYPSLII